MVLLTRKIMLSPEYLDEKVLSHHLVEILRKKTMNECTEKDGYVISLGKIKKIVDAVVTSANTDIIFTVVFEAVTLKPKVGDVLEGNVCMIFDKGIFISIKNKMKVLIPENCLEGYKYNPEKATFIKDKKSVSNGDILKVKVSGVKYSKKNFNCFGCLC
jgi:DNA-directed RNA polymerase subunit E'/Rpb7